MPKKISLRSTIILYLRLEIPLILKNYLVFPLFLLLVLLYPFVLINMIHELAYTPNGLLRQRLPQIVLSRQVDLESPYSYIIKILIYIIKISQYLSE